MNPLQILYQDKDIIVVNKPAGLAVHKKSPSDPQETLVDILLKQFPEIADVGVDSLHAGYRIPRMSVRPGIVHRLDKYTSGVMVVAHNQETFEWLTKQFKDRLIEKQYFALVVGNPKQDRGTIELPIGSLGVKKTTRHMRGGKARKWREARTDWQVSKRYEGFTLLSVTPKTGRTHQIRVHLSSIGLPIACDFFYGGKNILCPAGLSRFFLHASRLRFSLPGNRKMEFSADIPPELQEAIEKIS
ncbi:MAG: RluA family pseudouridine synthase [Candidatus Spechtbacteria bacterium]|nr:RluA family pseudouridine synthase [Candidatus Spechtbacteria bacterium]